MNKITGYRKGFNSNTKAISLDSAAANNSLFAEFTDPRFLDTGFKNLIDSSPVILGESISKRTNQNFLNKLNDLRKQNYNSLWYESGWITNYKATGLRIKTAGKSFFPTGQLPYSTITEQGYCLDRILTANFSDNYGIPYGEKDEYPENIQSGQKYRICGYVSLNDPISLPFISPYKNIYELVDHSGYQIGSVGRNFYTRKQLQSLGFSASEANYYVGGAESGVETGRSLTYNKIYLQDNIPNLDWCITNKHSIIYTNVVGQRNSLFDNPYSINKNDTVKYRIFVFSGSTNWIPTGESPKTGALGYGPYFQANNTGLYKLYNNNFNANNSGTLNDREIYHFSVFNTGDIPKNFYISSQNNLIEIIDDNYKETDFYHPDNTNLSGEKVKYYTVGKNSSIKINYRNNYQTSGRNTFTTLANGTKLYTNTGALILNEVTGTILVNNKLNFLTSKKYITANQAIIANNSRVFTDDYFYFAQKNNNFLPIQTTGSSIAYNIDGKLLINNTPIDSKIFGLTIFATGRNIESERNLLKSKFISGMTSLPTYQSQVSLIASSNQDPIELLNTQRQYLKYSENFSGLFVGPNNSVVNTKNGFNPTTGAVQLDLLFKINDNALPTFDSSNENQEYISINFSSGNGNIYQHYNTTSSGLDNLNNFIFKRGYKYNLVQTNLSDRRPLAVKGDISGLKIISPNMENYRLLQFFVNPNAESIEFFSVSTNPITGNLKITGASLDSTTVNFITTLPKEYFDTGDFDNSRTGAKYLSFVNNKVSPILHLDINKTYQILSPTTNGGSGFYFYTGTNIFGSGRSPYTGNAILSTNLSGALLDPVTQIATGFTTEIVAKLFTVSAGHLPNNLYYGNLYSANAGNKINLITPNTSINKFKTYNLPTITGVINLITSDENREFINIPYSLIQNTGNFNIFS
jgi:hypothetical protein